MQVCSIVEQWLIVFTRWHRWRLTVRHVKCLLFFAGHVIFGLSQSGTERVETNGCWIQYLFFVQSNWYSHCAQLNLGLIFLYPPCGGCSCRQAMLHVTSFMKIRNMSSPAKRAPWTDCDAWIVKFMYQLQFYVSRSTAARTKILKFNYTSKYFVSMLQ